MKFKKRTLDELEDFRFILEGYRIFITGDKLRMINLLIDATKNDVFHSELFAQESFYVYDDNKYKSVNDDTYSDEYNRLIKELDKFGYGDIQDCAIHEIDNFNKWLYNLPDFTITEMLPICDDMFNKEYITFFETLTVFLTVKGWECNPVDDNIECEHKTIKYKGDTFDKLLVEDAYMLQKQLLRPQKNIEIERKFTVDLQSFIDSTNSKVKKRAVKIEQTYIGVNDGIENRIRIVDNVRAFITYKSKNTALRRQEFEFEVDIETASDMINDLEMECIIKTRYKTMFGGKEWSVDVFEGEDEGLVLAEIELSSENEEFDKPEWVIEEVTGDKKYYNSSLFETPYCFW